MTTETATATATQQDVTAPTSWDDWVNRFKPLKSGDPHQWGGYLHHPMTADYANIRIATARRPNTVWTLLKLDGEHVVTAGWSFVHHIGYFLTEVPYNGLVKFNAD